MKRWIAFWSILKKDIQNYYLKPPNISWGIMFPISWTLMRFIQSSGEMDARGFLPGLMAMSVLFGTMSMLAVTITFERKGRSFDRLMLAPISLDLLVLAKTVGAIIFGMVNAFIPIVFAAFFIDMSGIAWGTVIVAVLMIAITSTLLALLIATTATAQSPSRSCSSRAYCPRNSRWRGSGEPGSPCPKKRSRTPAATSFTSIGKASDFVQYAKQNRPFKAVFWWSVLDSNQ